MTEWLVTSYTPLLPFPHHFACSRFLLHSPHQAARSSTLRLPFLLLLGLYTVSRSRRTEAPGLRVLTQWCRAKTLSEMDPRAASRTITRKIITAAVTKLSLLYYICSGFPRDERELAANTTGWMLAGVPVAPENGTSKFEESLGSPGLANKSSDISRSCTRAGRSSRRRAWSTNCKNFCGPARWNGQVECVCFLKSASQSALNFPRLNELPV